MIQSICNIIENEKLDKYKIVRKVCEKKSYSRIYGEKVFAREKSCVFLLRFLFEGEIKEVEVQAEQLALSDDMIQYLKHMPGDVNESENYSLEPNVRSVHVTDKHLYTGYIMKILSEMKNCNVVIEQESYIYEWYSSMERHEQRFSRYNLFFLDLSTYYFMNTSFFESEKWKDIYDSLKRYREKKLQLKELDKKKAYMISPIAMSKILRKIVRLFCADYIWEGESALCESDIEKKKFPAYINLLSVPFEGIFFDAEGNQIKEKYLIEKGVIKNFLSNTYYSTKMKNVSSGNAGIINLKEVECYCIKYFTKVMAGRADVDSVIDDFESIEIKGDMLSGIALCRGEENFRFSVSLSVFEFFERVKYSNCDFSWNDNCWTTSGFLEF